MNQKAGGKTNILFLHHTCEIGGAELSLVDLTTHLDSSKYKPIIVLPGKKDLYKHLVAAGLETETLPLYWIRKTKNPFRLLAFAWSLAYCTIRIVQLAKRLNIQVIHTNSITSQLYGALIRKILGLPVIWHVRDILDLDGLNRLLLQFCGRMATRVICISNAVKNNLVKIEIEASKVEVVYNGIDLNRMKPKAFEKRSSRKNDYLNVGIIGRISPLKGHLEFIRAARLASDQFPRIHYYIIGESFSFHSDYKEEVISLAKAVQLEDKIFFLGHKDDIENYLQMLNVLVVPSIRPEAFGRVIIEAMSFAMPVIATRLGGPAEIVVNNETGFLVDPNSPSEIASCIVLLARDRKMRRRLGQNGLRRAEDLFTIERCVRQIEQIYDLLTRDSVCKS